MLPVVSVAGQAEGDGHVLHQQVVAAERLVEHAQRTRFGDCCPGEVRYVRVGGGRDAAFLLRVADWAELYEAAVVRPTRLGSPNLKYLKNSRSMLIIQALPHTIAHVLVLRVRAD